MRKIMSLVALLGLISCGPDNDPVTVTTPGNLTQRAMWQASLVGVGNFAAVRGTTQAADYGPYFDMTISVTNATAGATLQWRIFPGTCAAPGATQYGPAQAYPNLVIAAGGTATVTRTISGPLTLEGTYNVRVSTVAAPVTIVACGNLTH
jgi:hypothetical protein